MPSNDLNVGESRDLGMTRSGGGRSAFSSDRLTLYVPRLTKRHALPMLPILPILPMGVSSVSYA